MTLKTWSTENTSAASLEKASATVTRFLDVAATSMGRATYDKKVEDVQAQEILAHENMMMMHRDVYAAFLLLPGVTDRSRQLGLRNLLSIPRPKQVKNAMLSAGQETEILYQILKTLPPQRTLKIFDAFRFQNIDAGVLKANNARTRKLILRTILNARSLELWSVKYRKKIRRAFTHAWGKRKASIIKAILSKKHYSLDNKEWGILKASIDRYSRKEDLNKVYECVSFVLGNVDNLTIPLFVAFEAAKTDLGDGAILPHEVLEGIRSTYHPKVPFQEVTKLSARRGTMTRGQKMVMQRTADKANIDISFDPMNYDPYKLYIYAFERGMDKGIRNALVTKAEKAASKFPVHYEKVGIVIDASDSMKGSGTTKLHPISKALALRDMLQKAGKKYTTAYVGGGLLRPGDDALVYPQGSTSLSEAVVKVMMQGEVPEAVFIVSDGYENTPSGRFAETAYAIRSMGIHIPIYHLNPVSGKFDLSPEIISLPISRPQALGLTILRGLVATDPTKAINSLFKLAIKGNKKVLRAQ